MDAAICLFAWDLADEGIEPVLKYAGDSGLTTLFLSSVYHAGWFVLPHNPRRTCYMPEDGVAYFHPNLKFFEETPLKPRVAKIAAKTDWFAEVSQRLDHYGLRLTAWTVCNHNTQLGLAHPQHTVRNALGDSYPHALTPASPAVREYVRGLIRNLASQYPLQSIFLEAPNYRGRRHGHHHERDLTPFGPLENELLDISFSTHDMARAEAEGIDAQAIRCAVAEHLKRFLASALNRPADLPETMQQFCNEVPQLPTYKAVLDQVVASLIAEINLEVKKYAVQLEGFETVPGYDWQLVDTYDQTSEDIAATVSAARRHAPAHQRIRAALRLGFGPSHESYAIRSEEDCRQCVQAAADNGANGVYFFNYSESPPTSLRWIKPALADVRPATGCYSTSIDSLVDVQS